jgi:hypothetical protein
MTLAMMAGSFPAPVAQRNSGPRLHRLRFSMLPFRFLDKEWNLVRAPDYLRYNVERAYAVIYDQPDRRHTIALAAAFQAKSAACD